MIYRFHYSKADYLDAVALEKANARQSLGVFHLILIIGVGCIVYLNLSTLRQTFDRNDTFAFGVALVVAAILLINYSPKIMPALLFPLKVHFNFIPANIIGPHEFEIGEKYLSFRYNGAETRVSYVGLMRVNHNAKTVLFYLQNGAVEAVPLRALGSTPEECTQVLVRIETLARKANAQKKVPPLPAWKTEAANRFSCPITEEDVIRCNAFHVRKERNMRMRMPIQWLYLLVLVLSVAGCCVGLAGWGTYPQSVRIFLQIFYVLEAPGCLIALLYWYRPLAMINFGMRQNFKLGQYPIGYFSERQVEWDDEGVAFRYGVFGLSLDWDLITEAYDDGDYLYLYQGNALILFLPKQGMDGQAEAFSAKFPK